MSKIFKPKIVMPPVPPAPEPVRFEPPEPKETTADADAAAKLEEDGAKQAIVEKKKKKPQTILTGPTGLTTDASTFETTLMS
tara:strand:- start:580 stop:825 length:246 start_codon:yes stop_codon:yes gene_type:complete